MVLRAVALAGFQSYRAEQLIAIEPSLTLVAGRNNVGKSALLRALQSWVEPQEGAAADFRLTYVWEADTDEIQPTAPEDEPLSSLLHGRDRHLLQATVGSREAGSTDRTIHPTGLNVQRLELNGSKAENTPQTTGLTWTSGPLQNKQDGIEALANAAVLQAGKVIYIAPRRVELRPQGVVYAQVGLEPDARNLANVLMHLQQNRVRDEWPQLLTFIRDAFPEIETISVQTTRTRVRRRANRSFTTAIYQSRCRFDSQALV